MTFKPDHFSASIFTLHEKLIVVSSSSCKDQSNCNWLERSTKSLLQYSDRNVHSLTSTLISFLCFHRRASSQLITNDIFVIRRESTSKSNIFSMHAIVDVESLACKSLIASRSIRCLTMRKCWELCLEAYRPLVSQVWKNFKFHFISLVLFSCWCGDVD